MGRTIIGIGVGFWLVLLGTMLYESYTDVKTTNKIEVTVLSSPFGPVNQPDAQVIIKAVKEELTITNVTVHNKNCKPLFKLPAVVSTTNYETFTFANRAGTTCLAHDITIEANNKTYNIRG